MIMLKKTEQMIAELNHIISRVNCIFWDEERTLRSIYADSYRLEIMKGNLCVDRPFNDANIKRFVRRLPVPDLFHEYVEYELKRSTPTIIDVKEELLQFCENRSQLNGNRVVVERIINKMSSVSEKCEIEFTEHSLVSTDEKLLLEIKRPLIRSLIAELKQELYNAINDVCEIYGDANEVLSTPLKRKHNTDEVKRKHKELIGAKLIKGDFDAFDAFMEHMEPQGVLEWIAQNTRRNGLAKNALIEFIKSVYPDKTERKDIINIATKYFNIHLVSSNFPTNKTNTEHWEKIKHIMT